MYVIGKVITLATCSDVEEVGGADQLCSGLKVGVEGAIHLMRELFNENAGTGWGLLLLYTCICTCTQKYSMVKKFPGSPPPTKIKPTKISSQQIITSTKNGIAMKRAWLCCVT